MTPDDASTPEALLTQKVERGIFGYADRWKADAPSLADALRADAEQKARALVAEAKQDHVWFKQALEPAAMDAAANDLAAKCVHDTRQKLLAPEHAIIPAPSCTMEPHAKH